jgi:integrase
MGAISEDTRFMILIAALGGLRISEVLGLQWRDVDWDAGEVTINRIWYRGNLNDTEEGRHVSRLRVLMGEFRRRYPGPHARERWIFIGEDGVTPPDERDILRNEVRPALKRLGIYYPGFGWHAFKRANVTLRQTKGGASPIEAQKGVGHASLDMTYLYTISEAGREQEHVARVYDYLMGGDVEGPKQ